MSRRIRLGDIFQLPPDALGVGASGSWKVIRLAEDNFDSGAITVMVTLRVVDSRREIQRHESLLQELVDTGRIQCLPSGGDTLLEILGPEDT
jgi:hypothetical protein